MQTNLQEALDHLAVAAVIRATMKKRHLTLSDVSMGTGIDASQISRFRNAQFKRGSRNLFAVCSFLGVQIPVANDKKTNQVPPLAAQALREIWDGSQEHELALAQLIDRVGPLLLKKN